MLKTSGIVLELQRDCLDSSVSASTILRKAKVIASKLKLKELTQWITSELEGYDCSLNELPPHRQGVGQPKFKNPYHGWCPIMTGDDKFGRAVRTVFLRQSISEIENLISGIESDTLIMYYNPQIQAVLQKNLPAPMECGLHFSKSEAVAALDFVRNKALDWTLELEQRGIIGEGISFNASEMREAQVVTNHIYGGNVGVLGSVSGDANNSGFFSAAGDISVSKLGELATQIRDAIPALPEEMRENIKDHITTVQGEATSSNPSRRKMVVALRSIQTILEGATGNLAASGILAAIAAAPLG